MARLPTFLLLGLLVGAVGLLAALVIFDSDSPKFSGEFDLSQETTYEPCLRAPGGCSCVRRHEECLERLRNFREFPVYWLGESFEGMPLTVASESRSRSEFSVDYGTCLIETGAEGCALPFTMELFSYCDDERGLRDLLVSDVRIRGARVHSDQGGRFVVVWTGGVVILVQSTLPGQAERSVHSLLPFSADPLVSPYALLDPPEEAACPF